MTTPDATSPDTGKPILDVRDLRTYYMLAFQHAADTILAPDVAPLVNPYSLFEGGFDRALERAGQESQQHLLTAIQDKRFQITGQSERSSGAMVKTEPVPCNFILVAAGNLDALQGTIHSAGILHVAPDQLGFGGEITGKLVAVDLGHEIIEDAHIVSSGQQRVGEVRTYKSSAAGDQDVFGHSYLAPVRISLALRPALSFFCGAYFCTAHWANSAKSLACRGGLV